MTLGGYSDWRLPNRSELKKLLTKNTNRSSEGYEYYINKKFIENMPPLTGEYKYATFWSSTEVDSSDAWGVSFSGGDDGWNVKISNCYALYVR